MAVVDVVLSPDRAESRTRPTLVGILAIEEVDLIQSHPVLGDVGGVDGARLTAHGSAHALHADLGGDEVDGDFTVLIGQPGFGLHVAHVPRIGDGVEVNQRALDGEAGVVGHLEGGGVHDTDEVLGFVFRDQCDVGRDLRFHGGDDAPGTNDHGRALDPGHGGGRRQLAVGRAPDHAEVNRESDFLLQRAGHRGPVGEDGQDGGRFGVTVHGGRIVAVLLGDPAHDDGSSLLTGDGGVRCELAAAHAVDEANRLGAFDVLVIDIGGGYVRERWGCRVLQGDLVSVDGHLGELVTRNVVPRTPGPIGITVGDHPHLLQRDAVLADDGVAQIGPTARRGYGGQSYTGKGGHESHGENREQRELRALRHIVSPYVCVHSV